MIGFTQLQFIFRFFPVFFAVYYIFPEKLRPFVMVAGSLIFYATGDVHYILLLGALIVANWVLSVDASGRFWLFAAIVMDVSILVLFKILALRYGQGMLPVGLSFYSFRMISYQADICRGRITERPSFLRTAAYFCMFPQLVSGPIARFDETDIVYRTRETVKKKNLKKTVKKRVKTALDNLEQGLCFFIPGIAMKVLLADHLAICWNDIGTIGYESIPTALAWMGAIVYTLELYFDFWGYSLMAAGLGVMLGFPFVRNFHHPYAAKSVSEFYRRWHITLGAWFRDYVYIPMGGSREGKARTAFNLFAVWLLTALWHGVTVNFIIWGMLLFIMILFEKNIMLSKADSSGHDTVSKEAGGFRTWLFRIIGKIEVLVLIPVTWVVFAIPKTGELTDYLARMFGLRAAVAANPADTGRLFGMYWPFIVAGVVLLIPGLSGWYMHNRRRFPVKVVLLVIFWASIYSISAKAGNPFLYFQF